MYQGQPLLVPIDEYVKILTEDNMKFKNIKVGEKYEVKDDGKNYEYGIWHAFASGTVVIVKSAINDKEVGVRGISQTTNREVPQTLYAENLRKIRPSDDV